MVKQKLTNLYQIELDDALTYIKDKYQITDNDLLYEGNGLYGNR